MLSTFLSGNLTVTNAIVYIISCAVVVFLTLPIHEFAHGFAAVKLGDNTPRWQGRLTLNPLPHIDYFGALAILIFGFGWAKPVQVNQNNFRNPKRDMAITALAGPFSNILMALVFTLIANLIATVFYKVSFVVYLVLFCCFVAKINISLAVFNLIPIPPLDGSRILAAVLPNRMYYNFMRYERYIYFGLLILLFTDVLDAPIYYATHSVVGLFTFIARLIFPAYATEFTEYIFYFFT